MAGYVGGASGSFDYVQADPPAAPQTGESWFDTDANGGDGEVKVYDGADWNPTGFVNHGDLLNVGPSQHHNPVTVVDPLTEDGAQGLGLTLGDGLTLSAGALIAALGNGLTIDANGNIEIPAGAVGTPELAFDPATQTELDGHAGDTTNPHNVTDSQTGAATALSNHEGDAAAHHSFSSENGSTSISSGNQGAGEVTVTFTNTYQNATLSAGWTDGNYGYPKAAGWKSWTTDANGDITGATIGYIKDDGYSATLSWNMMGELA